MNTASYIILSALIVLAVVTVGVSQNVLPTYVALLALILLAIATVSVLLNLLLRGSLYRRLKPQARPRRWVLFFLLTDFVAFAVWFPIWMMWPKSLLAKTLTLVFGVVFGMIGLTFKWGGGFMDMLYERKGWPLR